jgi:hypothetical protein
MTLYENGQYTPEAGRLELSEKKKKRTKPRKKNDSPKQQLEDVPQICILFLAYFTR